MITLLHQRMYFPDYTAGSLYMPDGTLLAKVLELPYHNNDRNISCIPEDIYPVKYNPPKPDRPYGYYRLEKTSPREGILMHRITYVKDLRGCLGIGSRWANLNGDAIPDMSDSGIKLQYMVENLPAEFLLKIEKKP